MAKRNNEERPEWADEAEVDEEGLPRAYETTPDKDGIKTVVTYKRNDSGEVLKVTRTIKVTKKSIKVPKGVSERKTWPRFGEASGCGRMPIGVPEPNVTLFGEDVYLEFPPKKQMDVREDEEQDQDEEAPKFIATCRICGAKGEHWSHKCPYKDAEGLLPPSLGGPSKAGGSGAAGGGGGSALEALAQRWENGPAGGAGAAGDAAGAGGGAGGRYVPPGLRGGGRGGGGGDRLQELRDKEQYTTLRVTNISEEMTDQDLHELFRPHGAISRTYLAKDRDTGLPRGYAFVSYYDRYDAEAAKAAVDGHGFNHLVLKVEWAKPSAPRPDRG